MKKHKTTPSLSRKFAHLFKSNKVKLLVVVVAFAFIGIVYVLATRAAGPFVSAEAENGTVTAPASKLTDGTASGGSVIKFGSATTPPPPPPTGETTFVVAAIPDTQVEVGSTGSVGRYNNRIDWIIANKTSKNIKMVWQVGDLQDWDDDTHSHYVRASAGLTKLEQAGVPYALSVGNHDTKAVMAGGSAGPGDTSTNLRDIPTWDQYYPPSRFPGIHTLCSEFAANNTRLMAAGPTGTGLNTPTYVKNQCASKDTTANAYRTFTAGGLKWIVINYELWPRQVVQEWMKIVLEKYPDHNAILFTHMFLGSGSASLTTDFGGYGSPQGSPKSVFDNVISKYSNVKIVSSGHTNTSGCAQLTGSAGNKIYAYLNNRHEGSPPPNHLRLLTINTSANSLTSQQYVPQDGTTMSQQAECNATGVTWVR